MICMRWWTGPSTPRLNAVAQQGVVSPPLRNHCWPKSQDTDLHRRRGQALRVRPPTNYRGWAAAALDTSHVCGKTSMNFTARERCVMLLLSDQQRI